MIEYSEAVLRKVSFKLLELEQKHMNKELISEKTGEKMKGAEVEEEFEKALGEVVESYEI